MKRKPSEPVQQWLLCIKKGDGPVIIPGVVKSATALATYYNKLFQEKFIDKDTKAPLKRIALNDVIDEVKGAYLVPFLQNQFDDPFSPDADMASDEDREGRNIVDVLTFLDSHNIKLRLAPTLKKEPDAHYVTGARNNTVLYAPKGETAKHENSIKTIMAKAATAKPAAVSVKSADEAPADMPPAPKPSTKKEKAAKEATATKKKEAIVAAEPAEIPAEKPTEKKKQPSEGRPDFKEKVASAISQVKAVADVKVAAPKAEAEKIADIPVKEKPEEKKEPEKIPEPSAGLAMPKPTPVAKPAKNPVKRQIADVKPIAQPPAKAVEVKAAVPVKAAETPVPANKPQKGGKGKKQERIKGQLSLEKKSAGLPGLPASPQAGA